MGTALHDSATDPEPFIISRPDRQLVPVVFSSPHSGRYYPDDFVALSCLGADSLRSSEDSFVDELYGGVTGHGAVLIAAQYARAYCDSNREPYELDPLMFSGPLPPQANTRSPRVVAGLGTIPRIVGGGAEIYRTKLGVDEIETRLARSYRPYHQALNGLLAEARKAFGWSLLVDCHSMPAMTSWSDESRPGANVVLGDCHSGACSGAITQLVADTFTALGYYVDRNVPYAGGFTTRYWGHPKTGSHALQIEISRSLYLDAHGAKAVGFAKVKADIDQVAAAIVAMAARGFCL